MSHTRHVTIRARHVNLIHKLRRRFTTKGVRRAHSSFVVFAAHRRFNSPHQVTSTLLNRTRHTTTERPRPHNLLTNGTMDSRLRQQPIEQGPPIIRPHGRIIFSTPAKRQTSRRTILTRHRRHTEYPKHNTPNLSRTMRRRTLANTTPFRSTTRSIRVSTIRRTSTFYRPYG